MNEPRKKDDKIRCDACPVMCYIAEGRTGACDRYSNDKGDLLRVDPLKIICLLYTSPSPRDRTRSRMPSSA